MGSGFFIGPIDMSVWKDAPDDAKPASDLRIDADSYEQALLERWPDIGVVPKAMSHCVLYWELPPEEGIVGLVGTLFNDHQLVSVGNGSPRSLLAFILWHRAFVPDEYPLYLFHAEGWHTLPITAQITEQEIIDFTGLTA